MFGSRQERNNPWMGKQELTIGSGGPVRADFGEIHAVTTDGGEVAVTHGDLEVRQGGVAREDDSAGLFAQLRAVNGVPVRDEHLVTHEHERGTRVDDGLAVGNVSGLAADLGRRGADLPEA